MTATEHDDDLTQLLDPLVVRARQRVGQTLRGKWRLDVLLGVGGMAAVYAATHRNGSRVVMRCTRNALFSVVTIAGLVCASTPAFAGEPSAADKRPKAMRALRQPESLEQVSHLRAVATPSGIEKPHARLAHVEGDQIHRLDTELLCEREDDGQRRQAIAALDAAQVRLRDLAGPRQGLLRHAGFLAERTDARAEAATECGRPGARGHNSATLSSGSRVGIASKATRQDNRAFARRRYGG